MGSRIAIFLVSAALWGAAMFAAGFAAGMYHRTRTEAPAPVEVAPAPAAAVPAPASSAPAEAGIPDAETSRILARRALRDAGWRMHPGPVELGERLSDGSYMVVITLEDGRRVSGRLYKDRMRFRIAVDRRELFSPETTVRIKTQ